MIITSSPSIEGKKIEESLGLVRGNTIRARWFGRDIAAGLKHLVGGEIKSYTDMLTKAREEAIDRMAKEAKEKGGNAIVSVRFTTSEVIQGASEILVYGTAVKLK